MEWGVPQNFIWLWVLPAMGLVFFLSGWRRKSRLRRFGEAALVEKLAASFDPKRRLAKRIFLIAAAALTVLALCQPHFRKKEVLIERKGVDVMIAVDVSESMLAKDIPPTRLEKAKLELVGLIEKLKQDRIGIVAYAGEAFIQCPLTLDKGAAKLFLSTVSPRLIPVPGTAIGSAVDTARQAFVEKERDFKALVLLTDGENTYGPDPLQAAKRAREAGIRVFAVGIGTPEGSTVPGGAGREGFKKDREGRPVLSKLDEKLLKQIAGETGGVFYRSTRGEIEIDHIAREIRRMGQKGLRSEKSVEYEENYQWFLWAALILLWAETALSERRRGVT